MKGDITFKARFQITNFHDSDTMFLLKIFDYDNRKLTID